MRPVVGVVGSLDVEMPEFETVPFRPGLPVDAVLVVPGEFPPEGVPEWVPIVDEANPRAVRRAIRRWAIEVDEAQDMRGPGTVVFGTLANGRLRMGENAVREGHDRAMRIREIRVDGRGVNEATPGQTVALAFGPVPPELFRAGTVLRPGRSAEDARAKATPNRETKEAILDAVGDDPAGRGTAAVCKILGKTPQQLGDAFETLKREGRLLGFAGQWIKPAAFDAGVERLIATLDALHLKQPSQGAHPPARVVGAARLAWSGKPLDRILARLVEKGAIAIRDDEIRRPAFRVDLGERQRALLDRVLDLLDEGGVNPPNAHELGKRLPAPPQAVGEILGLGEDSGELVTLADGVLFTNRALIGIRERIRSGSQGRPFTLGEMRDSLGTNRRVAVALLERFDEEGFTVRQGETRTIRT